MYMYFIGRYIHAIQPEQSHVLKPCCHHQHPMVCNLDIFFNEFLIHVPGKDNFLIIFSFVSFYFYIVKDDNYNDMCKTYILIVYIARLNFQ